MPNMNKPAVKPPVKKKASTSNIESDKQVAFRANKLEKQLKAQQDIMTEAIKTEHDVT